MHFEAIMGNLADITSECLVLGVFEDQKMQAIMASLPVATNDWLSKLLQNGAGEGISHGSDSDIDGELKQTLLLHTVPGIASKRLLLVGCGKRQDFKRSNYNKAVNAAVQALTAQRISSALWALHHPLPDGIDTYHVIWDSVQAINHHTYRFDRLKSEAKPPKHPLTMVQFWSAEPIELDVTVRAVVQGKAAAQGSDLARNLANLPSNICTPTYLAEQATMLTQGATNLQVQVFNEQDITHLKMGAFLGVARGSREPPRLIVLHYQGADPTTKPIVLVGKGITFDSGGISIKPSEAMDEMKFDMSGAAAVLGTVQACRDLNLPINLVGVIPATENLPGGNATKPGDILTSMSGLTIEILNTDAEGRLILCDALTYSERFNPEVVIDIATLTGACMIALGKHPSGLFSNNAHLADTLIAAGERSGDRVWQLPLWEDYETQLESNFADLANVGGRPAGAITAACFLAKFAKKLCWAHLDIAGTAWITGDKKGATGRPVPLLTYYLLQHCGLNGGVVDHHISAGT